MAVGAREDTGFFMASGSVEKVDGERADAFLHEALMYAGSDELLEQTSKFIEEGIEAGEPTFVVIDAATIGMLSARVGSHPLLTFADMAVVGANPARIIPAWQSFVDDHVHGQPLRGIGQPVWSGRTPQELVECERHESLLNRAFAGSANMWLMCPYDVSSLDADTIRTAERNHPLIADSGSSRASSTFPGIFELSRPFDAPLSEAPAGATELGFDESGLSSVRSWIAAEATALGLPRSKVEEFVLAVGEIATNSVRHGGGSGRARLWSHDGVVVCEVTDRGSIEDPMVGRREPSPEQEGGFGFWIANQLCDLVQIRSYSTGSVVRLHMRLDR